MNLCKSETFILNGCEYNNAAFSLPAKYDFCIYEVFRVMNGVPLFLDDHLKRFYDSALGFDTIKLPVNDELIVQVRALIQSNNFASGNIRMAYYSNKNAGALYLYYIAHSYPDAKLYNEGVKLSCIFAERPEPGKKVFHESLKYKVDSLLKNSDLYEVLLIDKNNYVTEGSRSNIFFVKDDEIFTAPSHMVLQGVTRKYVLMAIELLGLKCNACLIAANSIGNFNAAFLTGTSPKVLPVNTIDGIGFNTKNEVVKRIAEKYNELIDAYIRQYSTNA